MTAKRDLKSIIRDRQRKTGESYTTAHAHVMRERAKLLGEGEVPPPIELSKPVDAVVLAVAGTMAIIRVLDERTPTLLHANGLSRLAPGHFVIVRLDRSWADEGESYARGKIEDVRIDVARLALEALPLEGGELEDLREIYEAPGAHDPYAPLWEELTAKPRACFEMDGIAWGAFPGADPDECPTVRAVELKEAGDRDGARQLLMETLANDLRCLDAHAHLGNLVFDRSPERAIVHYEIGMKIGELSLPEGFDGVLAWSAIYNRPFLRCLHGYGLCLWRLGRLDDARRVFERILALNPNDNQGVRFCWNDVREGISWKESQRREARREREIAKSAAAHRARLARRASTTSDPQLN